MLPTRVHAIVLVSKVHKPTMRALAYAKATRPNVLEAVLVDADSERDRPARRRVGRAADRRTAQGAVLAVPRDHPADRGVRREIRAANPRGVVAVYIPEYVVGRWWEQLLHNQTALRLKGRLLFTPGVMVTSVPYQLRGSPRTAKSARPTGSVQRRARPVDERPRPRRRSDE